MKALSGVIRVLPFSGLLFSVGIFALLGFPPFGSFMAEMLILSGVVQAGNLIAFTLMCAMLTVIFVATGLLISRRSGGRANGKGAPAPRPWSRPCRNSDSSPP